MAPHNGIWNWHNICLIGVLWTANVSRDTETSLVSIGDVLNSGFRLFSRIRIVLWTIQPNKNTNTNSVVGWAFWCCTCCFDIYHLMSLVNYSRACMLSSNDPLPFIRLIVSQNQAVWARAAGTDWVNSAVHVTSCTIHVQTNYSYSFWWHYLSKYEYTIRTTIQHQSKYEANLVSIADFMWSADHNMSAVCDFIFFVLHSWS